MDAMQIQIKLFLVEPAQVSAKDLVPVFHGWIQKQALPGELLLDVADYSHVHHGPGAVLIAHESHYALDQAEGRCGLLYVRKRESKPVDASARLAQALRRALYAAQLIASDAALNGRVSFRTDEWVLRTVDRLRAPNNEASFKMLRSELTTLLRALRLTEAQLEPVGEARAPLGVRVTLRNAPDLAAFLARLPGGA